MPQRRMTHTQRHEFSTTSMRRLLHQRRCQTDSRTATADRSETLSQTHGRKASVYVVGYSSEGEGVVLWQGVCLAEAEAARSQLLGCDAYTRLKIERVKGKRVLQAMPPPVPVEQVECVCARQKCQRRFTTPRTHNRLRKYCSTYCANKGRHGG